MESRNRDLLRAENRIEELDEEQENEDNKSVTSSGKSRIGLAYYSIELRLGSLFEEFFGQNSVPEVQFELITKNRHFLFTFSMINSD